MARCSFYLTTIESQGGFIGNRARCSFAATAKLVAPDGQDCRGAYYCPVHGQETTNEYQVKLGETWTLRPLTEYEKV